MKPALADENTVEGLEAFTEYWLELFSYGYETNDWAPFEAVTDPGCRTCANVRAAVGEVYGSGGWVVGAQSEMTSFKSDFVVNTHGSIGSYVEVVQGETKTYLKSGELDGEDAASEPTFKAIFSVYQNGQWKMLDFGSPEGTIQ